MWREAAHVAGLVFARLRIDDPTALMRPVPAAAVLTWFAPMPTLGLQIRFSLIQGDGSEAPVAAVRFETT